MHKILGTCTPLLTAVPLVFLSERWLLLLGSWQFVLSKWYLHVPLPCPSLDVVQFPNRIITAQNEGGKKLRSSLRTIRLSHIVLQFSDYRDTETQTQTRICKESHGEKNTTNSNCARATSRSFLSERAVGQVNFQGVSSQPHGIKRDAQQRGIERLKH